MKTKHTHFLLDLVESSIIIIASIAVKIYPEWKIIDPICALFLILVIYVYTFRATMDCIRVLMERAPIEINLVSLKNQLSKIDGVIELHDLHVWSLNLNKISMSCHITAQDPIVVLQKATEMCKKKFNISHTTIQVEQPCVVHDLDCANSLKLK